MREPRERQSCGERGARRAWERRSLLEESGLGLLAASGNRAGRPLEEDGQRTLVSQELSSKGRRRLQGENHNAPGREPPPEEALPA